MSGESLDAIRIVGADASCVLEPNIELVEFMAVNARESIKASGFISMTPSNTIKVADCNGPDFIPGITFDLTIVAEVRRSSFASTISFDKP